ncbi:TIGR02594 family protein [Roseococcus sp. SYP-B2431]|uniref:TIGR02594 family protein n=1 Tax=Roseococcus sp. SYP-B2431 TaxID=2496640 RepID=UPI00103DD3D6|nr:TIGR02594 family protein [Roseococcus sp. SYP-B2431]TCH99409.1 TIGR02594 family protein [Roseococcus sp. SYP-B2431]
MADEVWGPFESEETFTQFRIIAEDGGTPEKPVLVEELRSKEGKIFAIVRDLSAAAAGPPAPGSDIPDAPPVAEFESPDPAPAGAPGTFVSARKTAHLTITYLDAQGRGLIRQGGTRAWRNCNPGNIQRGPFALGKGAIGDDGRFAVFPDEGTGRNALVALLRGPKYFDLSLRDAIFKYAPPTENPSDRYVQFVSEKAGIGPAQRLREADDKIPAMSEAIKVIEGWKEGEEALLGATGAVDAGAGKPPLPVVSRAAGNWMEIARQEAARPPVDRTEWAGGKSNPRILDYFRIGTAWREVTQDETDWCAAFVNYCLVNAGHPGTNSPGARSFFWNRNGRFESLAAPKPGCIVVIRRLPFDDPKWALGPGHVGFFVAGTDSSVTLLGGNQSNTVRESNFPKEERSGGKVVAKVVAYMMPITS